MSQQKILVLDDDLSHRELVKEVLEDEGFEAVTATSNEEALRILHGGGISGVVSDWNLDPKARPIGPHADSTILAAKKMGLPILVRTGTDDSTGKLETIVEEGKGLIAKEGKESIGGLLDFFRRK